MRDRTTTTDAAEQSASSAGSMTHHLTFGSLFAGIGGFDLGLERSGMRCEWQVEIDPYARAVLAKHWPDVRRWGDVRTFPPKEGEWGVDVICGGFPCQDISIAGKGGGLAGARSGLWHEFARIIGELRPRFVIVENVAALLDDGMGTVVGDLASLGYDAEWHVIPASAVGAPHRRERVWIVAYSDNEGESNVPVNDEPRVWLSEVSGDHWRQGPNARVSGVDDGIPGRMDRTRGIGNAVVPQIVEVIGRAIIEAA